MKVCVLAGEPEETRSFNRKMWFSGIHIGFVTFVLFSYVVRGRVGLLAVCLYPLSCFGMLSIVARLGGCFDRREKCWSVTGSLV